MPKRVARIIELETTRNKCPEVIGNLASLLELDPDVAVAYLCHHSATQISKISGEGNHFCAYRNIQMMLPEPHPIYTISRLQEMIETAWDRGFNPESRIETGGIRGTRKHIGTSEVSSISTLFRSYPNSLQAQALFQSLNISCSAKAFGHDNAWKDILDSIEGYFKEHIEHSTTSERIHLTTRSPIFLQRPSHSMTVIGIERSHNGQRQLLVFDPAYQPPKVITSCLNAKTLSLRKRLALFQYRRNERYLRRFRNFEILCLDEVL